MGTDWAHSTAPEQRASCSEGGRDREAARPVSRSVSRKAIFAKNLPPYNERLLASRRCTKFHKRIGPRLSEIIPAAKMRDHARNLAPSPVTRDPVVVQTSSSPYENEK